MPGKRSKRLWQIEVGAEGNLNTSDTSNATVPLIDSQSNSNKANMGISIYEELTAHCNDLEQCCAMLSEQYERLLQETSPHNSSHITHVTPIAVEYVIHRKDSVPKFKAEILAAFPFKRNQEVESWLRVIENVKPASDKAYICAARASCQVTADLNVNSPVLDGIRKWQTLRL